MVRKLWLTALVAAELVVVPFAVAATYTEAHESAFRQWLDDGHALPSSADGKPETVPNLYVDLGGKLYEANGRDARLAAQGYQPATTLDVARHHRSLDETGEGRRAALSRAIPLSVLAAVVAALVPYGIYRWALWLFKP